MTPPKAPPARATLSKAPTSIQGFDEITGGGLPKGRSTLLCGGPGCGKTLFSMEFLVRGAVQHGEAGVFVSFEETVSELTENVASLGFDVKKLVAGKKLVLMHVELNDVAPSTEYDFEALFVRIHQAIESIGAKRVVLDTLETLFSRLPDPRLQRAQLQRLLTWLKRKGVTAMVTAERGGGTLTRQGLEEYISDCVILLDHRVADQSSIRRLRIIKYRGSTHGTNEYPFLIDEDGFSVLPVTSLGLTYATTRKRISTGVRRLDTMLSGKGYFRGSTVLVSGTAGTGKTSLAARFVEAACETGERALYFTFEESPGQLMRNMRSIGIDMEPWVNKGSLRFHATRPTLYGLETHLATSIKWINSFGPTVVVFDPINAFVTVDNQSEVKAMMLRVVDFLKMRGITGLFTSLTPNNIESMGATEMYVSSLIDTWLLLRDIESAGERNRGLYVLKSRGMPHSNQIREFRLTNQGIELLDVYVGADEVLTGSARLSQENRDDADRLRRQQEIARKRTSLERRREAMEAQIVVLRSEFEGARAEELDCIEIEEAVSKHLLRDRERMANSRSGDL
jgi:circadian clock protein KaiC